MPIFIVPDGIHVQDLYMNNVTPGILAVRAQEVAQMSSWVAEYYQQSVSTSSTSASSTMSSTSTTSSSSPTSSTVNSTTVYTPILTPTSIPLVGVQPTFPPAYPSQTPTSIPSSIPPVATQTTLPAAPSSQAPAQSLSSQSSFSISASANATLFPIIPSSSTQVAPAQFTGAAVRGSVAGSTLLFLGILVALFF
jgi:hypothetical protein